MEIAANESSCDSHRQDVLGKDYTQGEGKLGIWLPEC